MNFVKIRRIILIPLLISAEIFLGVIINLLINVISGKDIFNHLNLSLNPSANEILIMLLILLFIICCILVLVEYIKKREEHKIYKADVSPDEIVAPVPADSKSKEKSPHRRAIMNIGLVVAGFAIAFIVQTILDNPGKPPEPPIKPFTSEPTVLKFAILPTLDFKTLEEQRNWNTFIKDMEKTLGISINLFPVRSYKQVIKAINNNDGAQIAWFGGKSYVEAAKEDKIEAFARTVNDDGSRGYYSYLIANKNNPIVSQVKALDKNQSDKYIIDAIKKNSGLTFAFNDKNSTSGFLVPNLCFFALNGVEPQTAFSDPPSFLNNHEATALAVADGYVDIATNNSEGLVRLERSRPKAYEKIKVIWESRVIPSDPIAYRKDLPDNLKNNIRKFFYNYSNQKVLNTMGWSRFERASDSTWDVIRELDDIAKKIKDGASNSELKAEAQSICLPQ